MQVFRITKSKWADKLTASGYQARWNSNGFFVIYSAENCSLACLENLVHRNGFGLDVDFSLVTILVPDAIKKIVIDIKKLPIGWNSNDEKSQLQSQQIGSAIIAGEKNVLINPNHPDFDKIKIKLTEPFNFDKRLSQ